MFGGEKTNGGSEEIRVAGPHEPLPAERTRKDRGKLMIKRKRNGQTISALEGRLGRETARTLITIKTCNLANERGDARPEQPKAGWETGGKAGLRRGVRKLGIGSQRFSAGGADAHHH